jgi:hypothetical protein
MEYGNWKSGKNHQAMKTDAHQRFALLDSPQFRLS